MVVKDAARTFEPVAFYEWLEFYYPKPKVLQKVEGSSNPEWLLVAAHGDAQEMLETVLGRERPLFHILD